MIKIIYLSDARAAGLVRYFTGRPCKNGHVSERLTSNGACLECCAERQRALPDDGREKRRLSAKKWREKNPEKVSEYNAGRVVAVAEWISNNKERKAISDKKWREKNREKCNEHKRIRRARGLVKNYKKIDYKALSAAEKEKRRKLLANWHEKNPHKAGQYKAQRKQATKLATPKWADHSLMADMYAEAEYFGLTVDHIIPLRSKLVCGLHCEANLAAISASDNSSKGNRWWPDMP